MKEKSTLRTNNIKEKINKEKEEKEKEIENK